MKITKAGEWSGHYLFLNIGLEEAVNEYERVHAEIQSHPPLSKETGTPEEILLHYNLEVKSAAVILFTACYVEALANLYLAFKTTTAQLSVLESTSFLEKWTVVPSLFRPDYAFPRDGELHHDLKRLSQRRNALVHLKEKVAWGKEVEHKGNLPRSDGDEHAFLCRCRTLPLRLVEHVAKFDEKAQNILITIKFQVVPRVATVEEQQDFEKLLFDAVKEAEEPVSKRRRKPKLSPKR